MGCAAAVAPSQHLHEIDDMPQAIQNQHKPTQTSTFRTLVIEWCVSLSRTMQRYATTARAYVEVAVQRTFLCRSEEHQNRPNAYLALDQHRRRFDTTRYFCGADISIACLMHAHAHA